jgi:organic radical activating enzyme
MKDKADDWRVVLVAIENAKCRLCGEPVAHGERAWYLRGCGLQCLECPTQTKAAEEEDHLPGHRR